MMFFRSERLFLRPAWPEDRQALQAALHDDAVLRQLPQSADLAAVDAMLQRASHAQTCLPQCVITRPQGEMGSQLLGGIGLSPQQGEVELTYWLAPSHWGQGYATEAGRAMLAIARALGHRRLVASHFLDNPAAGFVLQRLGFFPQGDLVPRHCGARGEYVPTRRYAIDLVMPDDTGSDEDPMGGGFAGMPRLVAA